MQSSSNHHSNLEGIGKSEKHETGAHRLDLDIGVSAGGGRCRDGSAPIAPLLARVVAVGLGGGAVAVVAEPLVGLRLGLRLRLVGAGRGRGGRCAYVITHVAMGLSGGAAPWPQPVGGGRAPRRSATRLLTVWPLLVRRVGHAPLDTRRSRCVSRAGVC